MEINEKLASIENEERSEINIDPEDYLQDLKEDHLNFYLNNGYTEDDLEQDLQVIRVGKNYYQLNGQSNKKSLLCKILQDKIPNSDLKMLFILY